MDQHRMYNLLHKAQETYGYAQQVNVAAEECLELALACLKYARYPDHTTFCESEYKGRNLRDMIIEETADVVIILHHLYTMFNIQPDEQQAWIDAKLDRLQRWLEENNPDMYKTTVDRDVNMSGATTGRMNCSKPNKSSEPKEGGPEDPKWKQDMLDKFNRKG